MTAFSSEQQLLRRHSGFGITQAKRGVIVGSHTTGMLVMDYDLVENTIVINLMQDLYLVVFQEVFSMHWKLILPVVFTLKHNFRNFIENGTIQILA
ncbi:MAG: hypothetical protein R2769_14665 [Saprospiraceae bacterium]